MSLVKSYWLEQQEREAAAARIAVQAGVLLECSYCGELIDLFGDITDAYRLANHLISKGEGGLGSNRRAVTDAIKAAVDNAGFECRCDATWRRDGV
ncbi:hypothetical protein [Zavarzinella formosa]|uniref:hypothetical protein n=1 Tax=Zavarzinella formosa TaxID=360055 RepID=UPI00030808D4|nr:hypothetical protein [Zavarzinella formosa]